MELGARIQLRAGGTCHRRGSFIDHQIERRQVLQRSIEERRVSGAKPVEGLATSSGRNSVSALVPFEAIVEVPGLEVRAISAHDRSGSLAQDPPHVPLSRVCRWRIRCTAP